MARRGLVRPLPRRAIRLREPVRRPLDHRLAKKVGLTDSDFTAAVQTTAEQITILPPAPPPTRQATAIDETKPFGEPAPTPGEAVETAPGGAPAPGELVQVTPPEPPPAPEPETAEPAAEQERRYREIFGMDETKPRRR